MIKLQRPLLGVIDHRRRNKPMRMTSSPSGERWLLAADATSDEFCDSATECHLIMSTRAESHNKRKFVPTDDGGTARHRYWMRVYCMALDRPLDVGKKAQPHPRKKKTNLRHCIEVGRCGVTSFYSWMISWMADHHAPSFPPRRQRVAEHHPLMVYICSLCIDAPEYANPFLTCEEKYIMRDTGTLINQRHHHHVHQRAPNSRCSQSAKSSICHPFGVACWLNCADWWRQKSDMFWTNVLRQQH